MSRKQGAFAWHQDDPPQNWRTRFVPPPGVEGGGGAGEGWGVIVFDCPIEAVQFKASISGAPLFEGST